MQLFGCLIFLSIGFPTVSSTNIFSDIKEGIFDEHEKCSFLLTDATTIPTREPKVLLGSNQMVVVGIPCGIIVVSTAAEVEQAKTVAVKIPKSVIVYVNKEKALKMANLKKMKLERPVVALEQVKKSEVSFLKSLTARVKTREKVSISS